MGTHEDNWIGTVVRETTYSSPIWNAITKRLHSGNSGALTRKPCEPVNRKNATTNRGEDPISYQFLNRTPRVTPPDMQFGCVFIIFGSDTYCTSIPKTKWRICRRSRISEDKLAWLPTMHDTFSSHRPLLLDMSRCTKMGLFAMLNSVWLVHCLKSQIAMTELTGGYFGFNCFSFQIIVINS